MQRSQNELCREVLKSLCREVIISHSSNCTMSRSLHYLCREVLRSQSQNMPVSRSLLQSYIVKSSKLCREVFTKAVQHTPVNCIQQSPHIAKSKLFYVDMSRNQGAGQSSRYQHLAVFNKTNQGTSTRYHGDKYWKHLLLVGGPNTDGKSTAKLGEKEKGQAATDTGRSTESKWSFLTQLTIYSRTKWTAERGQLCHWVCALALYRKYIYCTHSSVDCKRDTHCFSKALFSVSKQAQNCSCLEARNSSVNFLESCSI